MSTSVRPAAPSGVSRRFLLGRAGGQQLAFEAGCVEAVHRIDQMTPAPAPAASQLGWVEAPTGPVPVLSTGARLWGERASAAEQRIAVVRHGQQRAGLALDAVDGLVSVPGRGVAPVPALVRQMCGSCLEAVLHVDGRPVLVPSLEALVPGSPPAAAPVAPAAAPGSPAAASFPRAAHGLLPRAQGPRSTAAPLTPPAPRSPEAPAAAGGSLVLFTPAGAALSRSRLRVALSLTQVLEILLPVPLVPVPGAPALLRGVLWWQDRPLPVLDLGAELGLEAAPAERSHVVVVLPEAGGQPLGLLGSPGARIHKLPLPVRPAAFRRPRLDPWTCAYYELEQPAGPELLAFPDFGRLLRPHGWLERTSSG